MVRIKKKSKAYLFWVLTGVFCVIFFFIALNSVRDRSYASQKVLIAPKSIFTLWPGPFGGWRFKNADLSLGFLPAVSLKSVSGRIIPKVWNLAVGCPSGNSMTLQELQISLSEIDVLLQGTRGVLKEISVFPRRFKRYLCQSTVWTAEKINVHHRFFPEKPLMVDRLSVKKTDNPVIQMQGRLWDQSSFMTTMTYNPAEEVAVFTSDFWQRAHLDAEVSFFMDPDKAFVFGKTEIPSRRMTLGESGTAAFSADAAVSVSAEFSGLLQDMTKQVLGADSLRLDGALDARDGRLKPINLPADILRDVSQIPGLTKLERLHKDRALPKAFYIPETPFKLLRCMVRKEAGLPIKFSRIVLKHSSYLAAGEGWVDASSGELSFTGHLVLSEYLSQRLIKNVPGLELLLTDAGRLSFPFTLTGSMSEPRAHASMREITDKIIGMYRAELVRRGNSRIITWQ